MIIRILSKTHRAVKIAYQKGYRVINGKVFLIKERELQTDIIGGLPYHRFNISIGNRESYPVKVHNLVAFQKFGDKMFVPKIQVRHKDNNSLNNLDENILLGTGSENAFDRPERDRRDHAAKCNQQHSPQLIAKIRKDRGLGYSYSKLSEKYGLPRSTLSYYLSPKAKRTSYKFPL